MVDVLVEEVLPLSISPRDLAHRAMRKNDRQQLLLLWLSLRRVIVKAYA